MPEHGAETTLVVCSMNVLEAWSLFSELFAGLNRLDQWTVHGHRWIYSDLFAPELSESKIGMIFRFSRRLESLAASPFS